MKKETKDGNKTKKVYEKPELTRHGKLTDVGSSTSPAEISSGS